VDRFLAMTVFARVVDAGSFARAAERLGMSTSAVSRHVAELEKHLGARLLNRTTRRLSLTEVGKSFHESCVALLADLDEAERAAGAGTAAPRGTLRLTCGLSYGVANLAPAIADFAVIHPQVAFDLDLSDRTIDIVDEGYDLAVRIGPVGSPALIARTFASTALVACAAPAYLERFGSPAHPQDLTRHNCIRYTYSSTQDTWHFLDSGGDRHSVRVGGNLRANNGDATAAAAVLGMGITYEPDFIVGAALAAGTLVRVLPDYCGSALPVQAVYPSRRHLSAKVRAFVDFLVQRFGDATPSAARPVGSATARQGRRRRRTGPASR